MYNPSNFTNAWVMIAGSTQTGYSQVGFERTYGFPLRWFSQESGGGFVYTTYSNFNVGSEIGVQHTFRVLWIASCVCLRTYIDTTFWSQAPFNPFFASSGWGPRPWRPQFFEETGHTATDVPGQPAARTNFSALGAQRVSDHVVVQMPCTMTLLQNSSRWRLAATACDAFAGWTENF